MNSKPVEPSELYLNNQLEVLRSHMILREAIDSMDLVKEFDMPLDVVTEMLLRNLTIWRKPATSVYVVEARFPVSQKAAAQWARIVAHEIPSAYKKVRVRNELKMDTNALHTLLRKIEEQEARVGKNRVTMNELIKRFRIVDYDTAEGTELGGVLAAHHNITRAARVELHEAKGNLIELEAQIEFSQAAEKQAGDDSESRKDLASQLEIAKMVHKAAERKYTHAADEAIKLRLQSAEYSHAKAEYAASRKLLHQMRETYHTAMIQLAMPIETIVILRKAEVPSQSEDVNQAR